jgi:hypothetical protein
MPDVVRCFNDQGLAEFARWIRAGALGRLPSSLLTDNEFSSLLSEAPISQVPTFKDRYEFGVFVVELLRGYDAHILSYNRGLWSWLSAFFFEQLAPVDANGKRALRRPYVYILGENRLHYRHLVRAPWYLVRTHGQDARYLLAPGRADDAPLSRQSYLLDQLAARQFVISSRTLIGAARRLYTDPISGRQRRGAGAKGKGSPRRLALIANQLALTYDIHNMSVDQFMSILPREFR